MIGPCNHAFIFASSPGRPVCASSLLLSLLCSSAILCFPLPSLFFFFLFPLSCFCFPCFFSPSGRAVFVLPCGWYFGSSAALSWVGASARPVCLPLCWGFGSLHVLCPVLVCDFPVLGLRLAPCFFSCSVCVFGGLGLWLAMCCVPFWCVISLCWGFGLPRVFFPVLCVFSVGWGFGSPGVFCLVLLCVFSVLGLRLAASTWCWASARPFHASFCLLASSGWVFCLGLFVVMDFLSGLDRSDSESSADEAVGQKGNIS